MLTRRLSVLALLACLTLLTGCACCGTCGQEAPPADAGPAAAPDAAKPAATEPGEAPEAHAWRVLFDGKTLGKWKVTEFGGQGEVVVEDGEIHLPFGNDMTGITWQGEPPARMDYELKVVAMKHDGSDFFAATTFPVDDHHASFINGGWGGTLIGISSLNGLDASENLTGSTYVFDKKKWYTFIIRVTPEFIEVSIDGENVIKAETTDIELDTRIEMELCKPLGIATWRTYGKVKSIAWRPIGK